MLNPNFNRENEIMQFAKERAKKQYFSITYNNLVTLGIPYNAARQYMCRLVKKQIFVNMGTKNKAEFVLAENYQQFINERIRPQFTTDELREIQHVINDHEWGTLSFHNIHLRIPSNCKLYKQYVDGFTLGDGTLCGQLKPNKFNNGLLLTTGNFKFMIYEKCIDCCVTLTDEPIAVNEYNFRKLLNRIRAILTEVKIENMGKKDKIIYAPSIERFVITQAHIHRDSLNETKFNYKEKTFTTNTKLKFRIYNHIINKVKACRYEFYVFPRTSIRFLIPYIEAFDPLTQIENIPANIHTTVALGGYPV